MVEADFGECFARNCCDAQSANAYRLQLEVCKFGAFVQINGPLGIGFRIAREFRLIFLFERGVREAELLRCRPPVAKPKLLSEPCEWVRCPDT